MRFYLVLCILALALLLPKQGILAQDDVFDNLVQKARSFTISNSDSSLYYRRAAVELASRMGDRTELARAYELLSMHWYVQAEYQEAIARLDTALTLADASSNAEFYGFLLQQKGWNYLQLLNYDSAIYYIHQAKDHFEAIGHAAWAPYYYLGEVYKGIDDKERASQFYTKALEISRPAQVQQDHGFLLYMIAYRYRSWGWDEKAANLQEEYLRFQNKNSGNILDVNQHVMLPDLVDDPELRKKGILRFLEYHEKNGNVLSLLASYSVLGNIETHQGHHVQALQYYSIALEKARVVGEMVYEYSILYNIYLTQKEMGDLDEALASHEQLFTVRDSLRNMEKLSQMQDLEIMYETTQKEQALAIKELELVKSRRTQLLTFLGLIALAVAVTLALIAVRTKQRSNKKLGEKNDIISQALKEKDILLREIHHRVKNNLQMISALLYLQGKSIDDPTAQDAIKESQNRVQSMAMLHQNLYQEEDLLGVEIRDYLERLFDHLFASYDIENERITLRKQIQDVNLDVDVVVPLALIVNELISNSLKHAFGDGRQGEIDVRLNEQEDNLVLEVADNGIGLPEGFDAKTSGNFGYKLIHILADRMGAEWSIQNDDGTRVILHMQKHMAA